MLCSLLRKHQPHKHYILATRRTRNIRAMSTNANTNTIDEEQMKFMQEEHCILVDEKDRPVGHESKKFCHQMSHINAGDNRALHRAFSVFLFNNEGKLLLQQRAAEKITFPLFWTNTCCSHPLHDFEKERPGIEEVLANSEKDETKIGVKHAALRKMDHELGIKPEHLDIGKFVFMTRILYSAPFDATWGEHEVDYCLMYQHPGSGDELKMAVNDKECEDVKFVSQEELKTMMADSKLLFTPWFKLICERFLFKWWDSMTNGEGLEKHRDLETVHNMIASKQD